MPAERKITKTYDYNDESGQLLYQVVRYELKDFRQRRPDGKGGWIWNLQDTRRVLYRLRDLLRADPQHWVFVVEGEKDADSLHAEGLIATTCAMGAGKWDDSYSEFLNDRKFVAIIPDNDDAGRRHAKAVAESLLRVGVEERIIELPGLEKSQDVSDWLNSGGTADKLLDLAENVEVKTELTTPFEPIVTHLCDVEAKKVFWLWKDRIPMGSVSLIVGDPGLGKSILTMTMAAHVTKGQPWPDTPEVEGPAGSVVLLTGEDNLADVVRVRLDAAGADVSKVVAIEGVRVRDDEGKILDDDVYFNIDQHIPALELAVERTLNVRLVIIDPISAFMGRTDSHKNAEVRRVLTKLASLAEKHNVAVVGVSHLNKNRSATANHRIIGSVAFNATARAVWYRLWVDASLAPNCLLSKAKAFFGSSALMYVSARSSATPTSFRSISWSDSSVGTATTGERAASARAFSKSNPLSVGL